MTDKTGTTAPILLFGWTGQIGHELLDCLRSQGNIAGMGRAQADLSDPGAITRCIREMQPSLIINAAAYTAVDAAENDPDIVKAVNATAPGIMAEEAKKLGIPLIHFSTGYVFDGAPADGPASPERPYRESDGPAALSVYGQSKLDGEHAIQAVAPSHLILRTNWVYSTRGTNFFSTVRKLASDRKELRIVNDQTGSPTLARAIAEATADIVCKSITNSAKIKGPALSEASGCYHLTAAGETSWHGFAEAILDGGTVPEDSTRPRAIGITSNEYGAAAKRPAYSVLDNGRIAKVFGIALPHWQIQLQRCLEQQTMRLAI